METVLDRPGRSQKAEAKGTPKAQHVQRAARLDGMSISPVLAISARAAAMRADGHDVISLTTGEPDFDTPDHIKDAATTAMMDGATKYTNLRGTPALIDAIRQATLKDDGLDYAADEVIACAGAKQVLSHAFAATLNPGDEVVIPTPCWASYGDIVRLAGGVPVFLPTTAEDGFRIAPDALAARITDRTRWLLLNSPSNPTGAVMTRADMAALLDVVAAHPQILVLTDDIYRKITFGAEFTTAAAIRPDLRDRILIANGVSKAHAMTGWRLGWGVGPAWLISAMAVVQSQTTSAPCSISQAAGVAALTGPQDHLALRCDAYRRRRDLVIEGLGNIPGLSTILPQGAFYAFPDCTGLIGRRTPEGDVLNDDVALAQWLLNTALVATIPGSAFHAPGHLRLSTAASDDHLKRAMTRLVDAAQRLEVA